MDWRLPDDLTRSLTKENAHAVEKYIRELEERHRDQLEDQGSAVTWPPRTPRALRPLSIALTVPLPLGTTRVSTASLTKPVSKS